MGRRFYQRSGKRLLDLLIVTVAVPVWLPLMLLIATVVWVRLGRPIIFRQPRPGRHGQLFTLYKFRSMTSARSAGGQLLPDQDRLTRFGRFLRSTSLDELPELWNVLRGEMSLVGPRPLLQKYLELYTPEQSRRHEVRPGITGWAQVNGRNAVDWNRKFEFDVWYVDHCNPWLDLRILCRTVFSVVRSEGIAAAGHATSPEFRGTPAVVDAGLVVVGAGGHAKVVIAAIRATGDAVSSVYDDDPKLWGTSIMGIPIRGPVAALRSQPQQKAVLAIGDNKIRERLASSLDLRWCTVVHPAAHVDVSAKVGAGSVIFAGAVVQADAVIGEHSIINTSASVDHDCHVGNLVHVGPGVRLAGEVTLRDKALLGTGSVVIPRTTIGFGTTVGAGGVVVHDLPDGVVAVGCPARVMRKAAATRRAA